jgi:hypothetical protein
LDKRASSDLYVERLRQDVDIGSVASMEPTTRISASNQRVGGWAADVYPYSATGKDINMTPTRGFVVPAGRGKRFDSSTPGRCFALKLLGRETGESIMMFEETLPAATTSLFHLQRDSDGGCVPGSSRTIVPFMPNVVPHTERSTGLGMIA